MAYNFKNLADVELLSAMPEEANVLVEVNGKTKRAPNIDVEAKIVGSETLAELPETGTVLAEVNGEIKRVPSNKVGGIDAIVFSCDDNETTICNHAVGEIAELVHAGANCVFNASVTTSPRMAVSTFESSGAMPSFVTFTNSGILGFDDGSWMFAFYNDPMDIFTEIVYHADGTIENSLFSQEES